MNMAVELMNFLAEVSGSAGVEALSDKIAYIADLIVKIIYVVLAAFLIVKGAILGMQIVKAADEPQVRQEKIGSLKWLVIGVAIAYGVAAIADFAIDFIADTLTL